ncbi:MAG: glycoside hydrolase family 95 protein [Oscillospiraceae bacterium]
MEQNCASLLWYQAPAADWNAALPVGNGRIGGMVFSRPLYETIQLNEDSIWSGGARKRNNPQALENLSRVRTLLAQEKIEEAEEIVWDSFVGTPVNQRHYQPLGELTIAHTGLGALTAYQGKYNHSMLEHPAIANPMEGISGYQRSLDLNTALCTTVYTVGDTTYTREVFASSPDNVLTVNLTADKPGVVSIKVGIDGRDDDFTDNSPVSQDCIFYCGSAGGAGGIHFAAYIKIAAQGGRMFPNGSYLCAEGCDAVTIVVSCRTSYRFAEYQALAVLDCERALESPYETLKQRHIEDYQNYYNRVKLSLGESVGIVAALPTDERLARLKEGGEDNKLFELYHNFSRYLMISGSREGTLPMNLQGIWNKDMWPAWGCKFTININTQMNYWGAEQCALPELHSPLFDLIERMRPNGRDTAREMYDCGGFVCHHNTDLWGDTAPQDLWLPATQWPMGAAWLCLHIWEHYRFTLDNAFLDERFDTLKEAGAFFVDFLTLDAKGRLVTSPSVSPENCYRTASGATGSLCIAPSMDSQIIFALFSAIIEAGLILGRDIEFVKKLIALRDRLPKPEIGQHGQIMEWAEDYDEPEPGHRHISQLFALYPAEQITARHTKELADAARATILRRLSHGGGHTGWSRAWIINLWARLGDGERVYENACALLTHSTSVNLFDMHPPFQIDGNFGGAAGITEALLQSTAGEILLLPALPAQWEQGEFSNLRARGGFTVSCRWAQGKVTKAVLLSRSGRQCRLVVPGGGKILRDGIQIAVTEENGALCFDTEAGAFYELIR